MTLLLEQGRGVRATDVRRWMVVALVFLLPLHTFFVPAGISVKPFLVILFTLMVWDALDGLRDRRWPWDVRASVAAGVLLVATTIGWAGLPEARGARLWFALLAGTVLLLVIERSLHEFDFDRPIMRAVVWSAAAMAVSAVVLSFAIVGTFGAELVETIDGIPYFYPLAGRTLMAKLEFNF